MLFATAAAEVEFRSARKKLKLHIWGSKVKSWTELVWSVDEDLWSKPYKVVLRKIHEPHVMEVIRPSTIRSLSHEIRDAFNTVG